MLRAALAAELIGLPSVSIVCEGFEQQAIATARGHGVDRPALAVTVGHVDTRSTEQLERDVVEHLVDQVIDGLTGPVDERDPASEAAEPEVVEPSARTIVVSGSLDDVQRRFRDEGWTDGLPIVPPTIERVERMLEPLGHDPWKVLGVAPTTGRDVTMWSLAVNAVMAGCVPDHVPVLLAVSEVLVDPAYGVEHSGNTTGADALIVASGASVAEFGLHAGQGALRDGVPANTAIGRWLRLVLRNVFGFTMTEHDKATFGNTFRVVLTEDHDTVCELGWSTFSADRGHDATADTVTLARMNSGLLVGSVVGSTPAELTAPLADGLARVAGWDLTHVHGLGQDQFRPLLVLSPLLARTFAGAGWSKDDVRRAMFEQARIPARRFEALIGAWSNLTPGRRTLVELASTGAVPSVFAASDDPDRLVPIVTSPDCVEIVVAGDPTRANAYVFANDGPHGWWTTAAIDRTPSDDLVCRVP